MVEVRGINEKGDAITFCVDGNAKAIALVLLQAQWKYAQIRQDGVPVFCIELDVKSRHRVCR